MHDVIDCERNPELADGRLTAVTHRPAEHSGIGLFHEVAGGVWSRISKRTRHLPRESASTMLTNLPLRICLAGPCSTARTLPSSSAPRLPVREHPNQAHACRETASTFSTKKANSRRMATNSHESFESERTGTGISEAVFRNTICLMIERWCLTATSLPRMTDRKSGV